MEEEFKGYRECRAEIIKLYNQIIKKYNIGNEIIDRQVEKYGKILGVQAGEEYVGI